jgi:acyl-coenzyme A synthetase/AMP-(fatty) acid ligase
MLNWFYKDLYNETQKNWDDLIYDLKQVNSFNPYCYSKEFYEIFKNIIISLLIGERIVILDSDFSKDELHGLLGETNINSFYRSLNIREMPDFNSKEELISLLRRQSKDWTITLFTSGTTGLPKKVTHTFTSITRFVKISEKNTANIWGFAYNPAHMAGIQVFFQALLNGNLIVRLFGLSKEDILQSIDKINITNISATPSFFRLLLPNNRINPTVTRITFGGEKFDEKIINQLSNCFPNAKITNVYASTEAGTLFASDGNCFYIKPEINHLIKIKNNELIIHQSLMGISEMTSEEWYSTGDIIEIQSDNPLTFKFVSRKNEMINVGGYKVNPSEVEEALRNIPGIFNARVYSKQNSILGNIICCEVVKENEELTEEKIRAILQSKIQEFKIPRMIRFVNQIETTRTGKIKRN